MDSNSKLLLVDLSAVFWWKWHASAGKEIDTAYNWAVGKVRALARGYEYVAICSEVGRTFRYDLDPAYKGTRPPKNPAALDQYRRLEEALESDGLLVWRVDGLEADDVIATAVHAALAYDDVLEVVIAGSDKDLLQLVGPRVTMYKVTDDRTVDEAGVRAAFGVEPGQIRDWLALVGDSADNVKGAKGIGPKTATALLQQFGSVERIYQALAATDDEGQPLIKGDAIRRGLLEGDGAVALAVKLVTLRTDAPIEFAEVFEPRQPKSLKSAGWDAGDAGDNWGTSTALPADPLPPLPSARPATPAAAPSSPTSAPRSANDAKPIAAERAMETTTSATSTALAIPQSTSIVTQSDPRWMLALEPNDVRAAYTTAEHLFNSRLFQQYGNPDAIFAVILAGRSMGIDLMTALRGMHVIEGKPCVSAQLMIGMILRSGKASYFDLVESTDKLAAYETHRVGSRKPFKMAFTIEDAERAKLWKKDKPDSNWNKYPRTMLRWRAATELARAIYPDVVSNVYTIDEMTNGGGAEIMDAEIEAA